jgi:peptide deformylase
MSKNSLFTPKNTTPLSALPISKPPLILTLSSSSSSQTATVRTRAGWFSGLTDNNKKKMNLPDTVKAGDPVLHEPAQEIDPSEIKSEKVQKIIDDMIRVMRKAPGVGLAAPQIGIPSRVSSIFLIIFMFLIYPFLNFVTLSCFTHSCSILLLVCVC